MALETGSVTNYALTKLQQRGEFIVMPGEEVYAGQVVGTHIRAEELVVNISQAKQLTNFREKPSNVTDMLVPPRVLSLDDAIQFLDPGDLLEVTPTALRIRKRELNHDIRRTYARRAEKRIDAGAPPCLRFRMHIVIVGAGDVGFQLARRLSREKYDITLIEAEPNKVARAKEQLDVRWSKARQQLPGAETGRPRACRRGRCSDRQRRRQPDGLPAGQEDGRPVTIARVRNPDIRAADFVLAPQELGADHLIHPSVRRRMPSSASCRRAAPPM